MFPILMKNNTTNKSGVNLVKKCSGEGEKDTRKIKYIVLPKEKFPRYSGPLGRNF